MSPSSQKTDECAAPKTTKSRRRNRRTANPTKTPKRDTKSDSKAKDQAHECRDHARDRTTEWGPGVRTDRSEATELPDRAGASDAMDSRGRARHHPHLSPSCRTYRRRGPNEDRDEEEERAMRLLGAGP